MPEKAYHYSNFMNVLYSQLTLIDVPRLADMCTEKWYNQSLCTVNESVIRLGVLNGEYHWHKHDIEDEFFFVLEGELIIDVEKRDSILLKPWQGYVVPRGITHRTRALERTIVLMVEPTTIVPTGSDGS